jgi:hypothetical protein
MNTNLYEPVSDDEFYEPVSEDEEDIKFKEEIKEEIKEDVSIISISSSSETESGEDRRCWQRGGKTIKQNNW